MVVLVIKVIELGPFGCLIDQGTAEDFNDIPKGYKAKRIENRTEMITIYTNQLRKKNHDFPLLANAILEEFDC